MALLIVSEVVLGKKIKMDPSWTGRRRVVRLSLLTCLLLAAWSMHISVEMAGVVFPPLAILAGSVIGSYVFGAAWERSSGVPSNNYDTYSEQEYNPRTNLRAG